MTTKLTPPSVFILEDDEGIAELLRNWVSNLYGPDTQVYHEQTVKGSEETLHSLSMLDVAVLDRNLPDGKGGELLPIITKFDAITIMFTAASPDTEIINLPINDYLVKPIDKETFVKRLSMLKKLEASNVLTEYSNARKASLLEYHLDKPDENALFRRFASRWDYDYLEIAHYNNETFVYELYTDNEHREESGAHLSFTGLLDTDLQSLLDSGAITPIGELLPTEHGYAWLDTDRDELIDIPEDAIAIYRFVGGSPEEYITDLDTEQDIHELKATIESKFQ
jgi:response regulator RpfG family c-di-GMP phosphodiesterase